MKLDILAFGAHPDDIELGCGATIAKEVSLGKKVGIVDLTRGELGTRGSAELRMIEGFGAMLSFELEEGINAMDFQNALKLIKPSMSLAGLESTTVSPMQTTHALLSAQERLDRGIKDGLIRFSVGIEEPKDLIKDIEQAIKSLQ